MLIGVPKELVEGELRVALVPDVVRKLVGGENGLAGARLVDDPAAVFESDVVVKVATPTPDEIARLRPDSVLIGFLQPLTAGQAILEIAQTGATSFAMEAIPRISRAQSMDALSSQANISGYRAALIGAQELGRYYPMLMTAAG